MPSRATSSSHPVGATQPPRPRLLPDPNGLYLYISIAPSPPGCTPAQACVVERVSPKDRLEPRTTFERLLCNKILELTFTNASRVLTAHVSASLAHDAWLGFFLGIRAKTNYSI
eukprot:6213676-Pleurochrysis_carterae.AAC.1